MAIRSTVVGSYPKPPDEGETFTFNQSVGAGSRALEAGELLRGAGCGGGIVRSVGSPPHIFSPIRPRWNLGLHHVATAQPARR